MISSSHCTMLRFAILLAIATQAHSSAIGRIVGGREVDITQFPYQVSMEIKGSHQCGGILLKPNVVLTAGHCIDNYLFNLGPLTIRAGTSVCNVEAGGPNEGEVAKIIAAHQHPKFKTVPTDYDVGILILDREFVLSDSIQTIQIIPQDYEIESGSLGTVTGWGAAVFYGELSPILQAVQMPKVDNVQCNVAYGTITSRMACYGFPQGGKDSCSGDSGGPMVHTIDGVPYLAATVSWGKGCALSGYPGVYADLQSPIIYDFIVENAGL